jgi:hypothetical protein
MFQCSLRANMPQRIQLAVTNLPIRLNDLQLIQAIAARVLLAKYYLFFCSATFFLSDLQPQKSDDDTKPCFRLTLGDFMFEVLRKFGEGFLKVAGNGGCATAHLNSVWIDPIACGTKYRKDGCDRPRLVTRIFDGQTKSTREAKPEQMSTAQERLPTRDL